MNTDTDDQPATTGRKTKEQRLQELHAEAMQEFDDIQAAQYPVRQACLQERRFYSLPGAQWEGSIGDQFENKPKFEFNFCHLAVMRIFNEYRNNRMTVDFTPKDGATNSELADVCDGLYRADEQDSGAQEAYDNAFEEAVGGGFGAWRLRAEYEDEDDDENEQQRVRIEPIFDADSCVFFDNDAKRQDKSDATRCFVLSSMTRAKSKREYGCDPAEWPKSVGQNQFDWAPADNVYVAEYYRIEQTTELIHVYRGLDDQDMKVPDQELKDDPTKADVLQATGFREVRQKRVKRQRVHKYILSGSRVESDEGYIAGKHIPIVPVYGKRQYVDGVERCQGHTRLAMDAQRLQNSLLSWLAEMAMRFDIEKPIFTPEQISGFATQWANDNVERYPYLLVNAMTDAGGQPVTTAIGYTKSPQIPPAMAALVQIAQTALQDLLGNQQAGEQIQPNLSGKAVELIQQRLDMQVFIYTSNFAKGMRRGGEIWLSMMKELLIEDERPMKTIGSDGDIGTVTMRQPGYDQESGREVLKNSLDGASFDVWADVGPSSNSQRASVVRALSGIASITEDPQTKQALLMGVLMNIEGEGLRDLRDWARAQQVRMGIVKPTDEEKAELAQAQANQQPSPNDQYLLAARNEADAAAELNRAKTVSQIASANLAQAQAEKTAAETIGEHNSQQIASAEALHGILSTPAPAAPTA